MQNLAQYLATFFQYAKQCSSLDSPFANCTSFWGVLYFILAICLLIGFKKLARRYTKRTHLQKPAKNVEYIERNQKIIELEQWPDSAFAEFSHERILRKFHKELNEN